MYFEALCLLVLNYRSDYKLCQVLDEYQKNFGDSWKTAQADNTQAWPYLNEALAKFQVLIVFMLRHCLRLGHGQQVD